MHKTVSTTQTEPESEADVVVSFHRCPAIRTGRVYRVVRGEDFT